MSKQETALVFGVGPGLGWHLVKRFVQADMKVTMSGRNMDNLKALLAAEPLAGVTPVACDVGDENAVAAAFEAAGTPDLVVFNAGAFVPGGILDLSAAEMERCFRVGCLGGFIVGQAALRAMVPQKSGTIILTGATASLRGSSRFAALAVPKFGLRALAQSMAREFGPQGIHVAHTIIDGQIASSRTEGRDPDTILDPAAIADVYYHIHRQHKTAWTLEIDLRPAVETF